MERFYIRTFYLKILHYFFFSFAVFSITGSMMFFDFLSSESLIFLLLGFFYCGSSMTVAYYYYRSYREVLEPIRVIRTYFLPYMILVLWTIGSMTFLVLFFPYLFELIYSFLFIEYYVFFFIIVGFLLSRFKLVSRLFEVYSIFVLRRGKKIAKEYACAANVDEYKIGSNPEIDEMLDDIWAHRNYPLPYVRKLEIAICERHIIGINRLLDKSRGSDGKGMDENLKKIKESYMEKIREIKQKVD